MRQGLLKAQGKLFKWQWVMLVVNHTTLPLDIQPCDPEVGAVRVNMGKPDEVAEFRFFTPSAGKLAVLDSYPQHQVPCFLYVPINVKIGH